MNSKRDRTGSRGRPPTTSPLTRLALACRHRCAACRTIGRPIRLLCASQLLAGGPEAAAASIATAEATVTAEVTPMDGANGGGEVVALAEASVSSDLDVPKPEEAVAAE